jgi:hypothetical protein
MGEKEFKQTIAKPNTRLRKTMRSGFRWIMVALVAFGLGASLIAIALYIPMRLKVDKANADLDLANVNLTSRMEQIDVLQKDNEILKTSLDSSTLHMHLLQAKSGVSGASLAVAADDYAGARMSLVKTSEALGNLSDLLGMNQKDVLTTMKLTTAQAMTDLKTDLKTAQPKLDQLTKNLVQLENNLFPIP